MKKICCVGHITHDKIITPQHTDHLNGGTAYYFAHGIVRLPEPRFSLVTAVGADDHAAVEELRDMGIDVKLIRDRAPYILKMPTAKIQIIAPNASWRKPIRFASSISPMCMPTSFTLAVYWPTTLLPISFAISPPKALYRSMCRGFCAGRKTPTSSPAIGKRRKRV